MEALSQDTVQWARRLGLSTDRIAFLAACPKFTVSKGHRKSDKVITDNPNHHLQRLGDCYWFRLRRRGTDIVENIGKDLTVARKRRDEMLAAFDSGKPIPYLSSSL
tara:strand:+ start:277 stop:594 length:318 start_codon:yes stop_codon:yes gene_type:complete